MISDAPQYSPGNETSHDQFRMPPVLHNETGELRKIGFEFEFSGLSTMDVARLITSEFGGRIDAVNRYYVKVRESRIGDFTIKIDTSFLYEKKYHQLIDLFGVDEEKIMENKEFIEKMEQILEGVFSSVVPYEIAAPPVEITSMDIMERIREILRNNHAEGTGASVFNAFALHINAELPSLSLPEIMKYLKAFLVLYPWLDKSMDLDLSRKLTVFINPFPEDYVRLVLDERYHPDKERFIHDYHSYNPDRNRPLDLYPALVLMSDSAADFHGIGNVKKRPTLHFRMPDSLVDKDDWTVAREWNYWYQVEALAGSGEELEDLCRRYLSKEENTFTGFARKWASFIAEWMEAGR